MQIYLVEELDQDGRRAINDICLISATSPDDARKRAAKKLNSPGIAETGFFQAKAVTSEWLTLQKLECKKRIEFLTTIY